MQGRVLVEAVTPGWRGESGLASGSVQFCLIRPDLLRDRSVCVAAFV